MTALLCPMISRSSTALLQVFTIFTFEIFKLYKDDTMKVLGVGAHFDDLELGCGGTLIRHIQNGDEVTMLVLSDSGYVNPHGQEIRSADVALQEGKKSAEIMGADLIYFDYPTFEIPFNEQLTKSIQAVIENREIDTIYSHWDNDVHRDHKQAAQCTLMAGRHAPRYLMYRSNYYETGHPFSGSFYIDISKVMEKKMEALRAHASEMERVNWAWLDFVEKQNAADGRIIGVKYAENFRIVRYLV